MKLRKLLAIVLALTLILSACSNGGGSESTGESKSVSIITPFISSVTTKQMVDKLEELAKAKGWVANVIDTNNDMAALASRMEDVIETKTDAIILVSTDPNQVIDQIKMATDSNIPVLGCDSGFVEGMLLNATSDNHEMGKQLTEWIFNELIGEGKVIHFTHRPHPGVIKRTEAFYEIYDNQEGVELVVEQHVDVPGPIESARQSMENLLLSNPEVGSIDAVIAGWDEPAIGAAQAIEAAGRDEIIVGGVDGNSQAVEMIKNGSALKVTISQNFEGMSEICINELEKFFNDGDYQTGDLYAPATVVTKDEN